MKKQQSFTLIEILVAMLIIGILSTFVITRSSDSTTHAELAKAKAFSLSILTSLPANFVSQWRFDGPTSIGSSATVNDVKDTWGANDGTVGGSPTVYGGNDCISGKCLSFNGTSDYVNCGTDDSLNIIGPITISAWIKTTGTGFHTIFSNVGANPFPGYAFALGWDDDNAAAPGMLGFFTGGLGWKCAMQTVNDGNWKNVVVTNDGTNSKFYINGSLVRTVSQGASTSYTGNKYIGQFLSGSYFSGLIDEVYVFDADLPISRIQENYYSDLNKGLKNKSIVLKEYNQRIGELKLNLTENE